MNENALKFFNNMAHQTDLNQNSVKLAHNTDFTDIDANFILKFANKSSNLLDLGSGTGLIVNKIFEHVKSIECLEPFRQFSDYIVKAPNVTIQNKSVFEYKTNRKFDLVTMFGFMHYFNEEEAIFIYKRIKNEFLMGGGKIIVKNQFGIAEDVNISSYSEEQKTDYYSQYRQVDKEIRIIKEQGFSNVLLTDIYPKEANRWENTHFYAITAELSV